MGDFLSVCSPWFDVSKAACVLSVNEFELSTFMSLVLIRGLWYYAVSFTYS
jgi:hypothetical protein